jgi:hypothetical protein
MQSIERWLLAETIHCIAIFYCFLLLLCLFFYEMRDNVDSSCDDDEWDPVIVGVGKIIRNREL